MIRFDHDFEEIIRIENLLQAWSEFSSGKCDKRDVQEFYLDLMDNILALHNDLISHNYQHDAYVRFNIYDPKPRNIHKATVRDRLLHRAIYRKLYPFFERVFISDSYSCRVNKGVHKALDRFKEFAYQASKNDTKTCWVLKGDIKQFFASINHEALMSILQEYIEDKDLLWLLGKIVKSFSGSKKNTGLPLGNLTSQLFVNIYMNEFDRFIKSNIKANHYIRYADDFVIFSEDKEWLQRKIIPIRKFLKENLFLELHPDKLFIKTLRSGVDFLGWIHFFNHRILRTKTKQRILKRIDKNPNPETLQSYFGLLSHGNTFKVRSTIIKKRLLNERNLLLCERFYFLSSHDLNKKTPR